MGQRSSSQPESAGSGEPFEPLLWLTAQPLPQVWWDALPRPSRRAESDEPPTFEAVLHVRDDEVYVAARLSRDPAGTGDAAADALAAWRGLATSAAEWNGAVGYAAAAMWKVRQANSHQVQLQVETSPHELEAVAIGVEGDVEPPLSFAVAQLRGFCEQLTAQRDVEHLTLRAEAGSWPLWADEGYALDPEWFGLPPDLVADIEAWSEWLRRVDGDIRDPDERRQFDEHGKRLWERAAAALAGRVNLSWRASFSKDSAPPPQA